MKKIKMKPGMVVQPSYSGGGGRSASLRPAQAVSETPSQKQSSSKRAGEGAQAVEHSLGDMRAWVQTQCHTEKEKEKEEERKKIKKSCTARSLWLTPVILATQEADMRRIAVQSQPEQIV
jgi:hypothetical protein